VSSENEAIAVFLDQATNGVIRLRMGQNHDGWVLNSVKGRAATLQKDQKTLVLNLPAVGSPPASAAGAGGVAVPSAPTDRTTLSRANEPGIVIPDPSRGAPFIPHSTPKNGEPDGL
jgi:general secretion pathway protein N